jgi:hypothetical protein
MPLTGSAHLLTARLKFGAVRWGAVLVVLAIGAVAGLLLSGVLARDTYELSIQSAETPRMTAESVASVTRDRLQGMEARAHTRVNAPNILSVTLTDADGVDRIVGSSASTGGYVGPFWVVTATGTFYGDLVPPGVAPVFTGQGFYVFDDATGLVVMTGSSPP